MVSRHTLQQCAIAISIASLIYNIAEGVVSVVFGAESSSHALIFFGIQSVIEVLSASLVVWRFLNGLKPGEEGDLEDGVRSTRSSKDLRFVSCVSLYASFHLLTPNRVERIATFAIGTLLVMLALAAIGTSIASLIAHEHPSSSNASLIISACATFIMFLFWVPKRYLAKTLNSSTMNGETLCTLSCIQFSGALLIGSLIYRTWRSGWWVDSATAIVIALLFAWEGYKMMRWASNDRFDGGCGCGQEERKVIPEVVQQPSVTTQRCCCDSGCSKPSKEGSSEVE